MCVYLEHPSYVSETISLKCFAWPNWQNTRCRLDRFTPFLEFSLSGALGFPSTEYIAKYYVSVNSFYSIAPRDLTLHFLTEAKYLF